MLKGLLLILFWGSVFIIFYSYFGFPLLLALRGLFFPKKIKTSSSFLPTVTVIIAAYNEADGIAQKLESVLSTNYPYNKLEIIVASDGSTDGTNEIVSKFEGSGVKLLALPRQGKNQVLNNAVPTASGEILIFTDADSILPQDSIQNLVLPFADPEIGGVSGDYRHASKNVKQEGERAYWNYDRLLKQLQSSGGSVSGASGALYAIRRSLFKTLPASVTDDFFTAMQVVSSHYRLIFEPKAVAYGPVASSAKEEYKRKVRIITRGLHGVWLMRHLLNPLSYGFFAIQLFSHKLLRRLIAIPLILCAITAPLLWQVSTIYVVAAIFQIVFHSIALTGFFLRGTRIGQSKLLSIPFHFDMIYYASLVAILNNLKGKQFATWGSERIANQ